MEKPKLHDLRINSEVDRRIREVTHLAAWPEISRRFSQGETYPAGRRGGGVVSFRLTLACSVEVLVQETDHIDVFGPRAFAGSYAIVAHANATHIKCEGSSLNPARASQCL